MGTFPGSLSEGVSPDEWWNVKTFEFRRGDENRPPTPDFSEHPDEWERAVPFIVPPKTRNISGDFHRPYATQKIWIFTIHRTTLPQLRCAQQLPQRGSRERAVPFIRPPKSRNISGDFHRPYENSENFTFHRITSQKRN